MLKMSDVDANEECFTHIYEGVATMFAVAQMKKSPEYLALEIFETPVELKFAEWVIKNRGVEQHRLDRITVQDLLAYPVTYCIFPTPESLGGGFSHLLVDGSHRYVKASQLGFNTLFGRVVPENLWRKFQVEVPLELAKFFVEGPSGIP